MKLRDVRLSSPVMERTDLMAGEGANRIRSGRLSLHRADGECPMTGCCGKGTF
jgi:hypothetical protein